MHQKKKFLVLAAISLAVLVGSNLGIAEAAAPDGFGPWADSVVSTTQGLAKDGSAIPADRSDPTDALGVAESSGAAVDAAIIPGTFYSLGFGGNIVLKFKNAIVNGAGNDLKVYEVTVGTYPDEKLRVEGSPNGSTWTPLGNLARDGEVDLGSLSCIQYVRLTDTSNKADFSDATADAYDLDAVKALHSDVEACVPVEWNGGVLSQGYWKTHDTRTVSTWNGLTWGPVKGNDCQNLANQALGFLNNWNLNPYFNGTAFRDTYFDSNGAYAAYDGMTMAQIKAKVDTITCSASSTELLQLKDVLDQINNGNFIWS